jgi:hypothetical protein
MLMQSVLEPRPLQSVQLDPHSVGMSQSAQLVPEQYSPVAAQSSSPLHPHW